MREYTVKQLARLAGVSIRTLHHYDQIRLLRPKTRTAGGYRVYGEAELLRLQQILFYRELGVPLEEIRDILDDPAFDPVAALHAHRERLQARVETLTRLLETVDATIARYKGEHEMDDHELYAGFPKETAERYRREAQQLYGERVAESERRLKRLGKEKLAEIRQEGEEVARLLAEVMDQPVESDEVQALVARHHRWIENFYPAPAELYEGLGKLYVSNPEFRAYYDRHREGLAAFLCEAIACHARTRLAKPQDE